MAPTCLHAVMMSGLKTVLRFPFILRARFAERRLARTRQHELAVCAIFREEAPFLDEWIAFHHGVGATHFYLYNNFSTDDFRTVLEPWIARGLVTLRDWRVPVGQLSAYRDCARRYRTKCRWIAFIDVDEYLFSPQQVDIRPILARFADCPAVEVHEHTYGAAGHEQRPAGPLVEAFTRRARDDLVVRSPVTLRAPGLDPADDASYLPFTMTSKTIANPRQVRAIRNVHEFHYWEGVAVNTLRQKLRPLSGRSPAFDVLRINHYWSRSLADLATKVARGDASTANPRDRDWHFAFEAKLNAVEDRSVVPIAAAIRAAQGARATT